jgi:hypothetical protein
MTVFHQCGDPVAGAGVCLCQHHGAAYAELSSQEPLFAYTPNFTQIADGATVVQVQITITERCCIVVNAALVAANTATAAHFEIERPVATIRTTQEDAVPSGGITLLHHAAWEVLDPGTYTYYLVNRSGALSFTFAAWIKAVASDCEG